MEKNHGKFTWALHPTLRWCFWDDVGRFFQSRWDSKHTINSHTRRNWLMLVGILFWELLSMFTCHSARLTLHPEGIRVARPPELPYIYRYIEIAVESPQLLVLELPYSYILIYILVPKKYFLNFQNLYISWFV